MVSTIKIDEDCYLYKKKQLVSNNIREKEYLFGIRKIYKYISTYDTYLCDNSNYLDYNNNFKNELDNNNIKILSAPNNLGKINKGAGIIESWLYNIEIIKKYDYIIHFEPRLILLDDNLINYYTNNFNNIFTSNDNKNSFNTGLFCIETKHLLNYIKNIDLNNMVIKYISLEDDLFNYINKNSITYTLHDRMGVIWHDAYTNKYIHM
jgi:hypothetical protein